MADEASERREPSITNGKLLNKIAFLIRDGKSREAPEGDRALLRDALYQFLKELPEKLISRQTITYWFEKGSEPSRGNAHVFLERFLNQKIDYKGLSPEQKQVHRQVASFLRASIRKHAGETVEEAKRDEKIYMVSGGNPAIRVSKPTHEFVAISNSLVGTYYVYRTRLSENIKLPLVQEVMKIFKRNRQLRFEHWYLRNGFDIDRFEGAIILVGNQLWFMGASRMSPERLRFMAFRKTRGYTGETKTILWGIMLTDGVMSTDEPGACRILLCQTTETEDMFSNRALRSKLIALSETDDTLPHHELLWRLVNNRNSAVSKFQSTEPVSKEDGSEVSDPILRVDQNTLRNATIILQE